MHRVRKAGSGAPSAGAAPKGGSPEPLVERIVGSARAITYNGKSYLATLKERKAVEVFGEILRGGKTDIEISEMGGEERKQLRANPLLHEKEFYARIEPAGGRAVHVLYVYREISPELKQEIRENYEGFQLQATR